MNVQRALGPRDRGFSLVEILVVIIIIGILAAVAVPVFLNQRKKGYDGTVRADMGSAAKHAQVVIEDNPTSSTPFTAAQLTASGFKKSPGTSLAITGSPATGYCIRGFHPSGKADSAGMAFWYDSTNGGMRSDEASAAPNTNLCLLAPASPYVALN